MATPLVSIGLPVRNRERLVSATIESLLCQTLGDFELTICDNQSSDRTPEICKAYTLRDPRVRYYRNETDVGIAYNHNRAFGHATGRYFHWTGSDDSHDPRFLERCVATLEAKPDRALCYTGVKVIDERGDVIVAVSDPLAGAESPDPVERFRTMLFKDRWCWTIYGLYRSDILRKTTLLGNFRASDRELLAQMALLGRFVHLDEPLFHNRTHSGRFTLNQHAWQAWHFRRSPRDRIGLPLLVAHQHYVRAIRRYVQASQDRRRCYAALAHWWLLPETVTVMGFDLVDFVSPTLAARGRALKRRLFARQTPFGAFPSRVADAPARPAGDGA